MKRTMKQLMKIAAHMLLGMLLPLVAQAQVSVSLSPVPHMQFLDNSGKPLANGCVSTFQAGTNTPAATYVDSGGVSQNTNPIVLDAGGFADIWLPNAAFKIKVNAAAVGVVNCSSLGVQQWVKDNISGTLGLLSLANTWTASNTFQQPVIITSNTNQLVLGAGGNQTTLNFPAPAGNVTLNMPSIADTIMGKASTCSPNLNSQFLRDNGTQLACAFIQASDVPGTFSALTGEAITGPTVSRLVKLTGAPSTVIVTTTTDTGGVIGICISGCSPGGSAVIQQSGLVNCQFDAGTTAGDYVQISATIGGDCHDAGASYPSSGQVIGRVLVTGGGGVQQVDLFGHEIKASSVTAAIATNLTAQAANIGSTTLLTPGANGFYRISVTEILTQAATTNSTMPNFQLSWTDPDANFAESVTSGSSPTNNTVGLIGVQTTIPIFAKSGVAIAFQTNGYVSVGATPMQYALHLRLEGPF